METSNKKKKVGFFTFTCDEGCSIYLIEIFNTKLIPWLEKMDIAYFMALREESEIKDFDIAFVEGVITSEKDLKHVQNVRANSKILITMGSCAFTGQPSGQRNNFDTEKLAQIQEHLDKFKFLPKALTVPEAVKVDDKVMGCPIIEEQFIQVMEKYLNS